MPPHTVERPPYERTAERPAWDSLPAAVRALVTELAGAPVIGATSAGGGFTRGFAGLLTLADGSEVFVKAASHEIRPMAATSYAKEARVLAVLPTAVPAPRLRWSAEVDDWVLLGIDPVRGRMPGPQWHAADLAGVVRACEAAAAALDPAPAGMTLSRLADDLDDGAAWRRWYDDVAAGRRTTTLLSPWARSALPDLHRMLQECGPAIDGEVACHGDLRPDNMVIDGNGAVWICDWNWLSLGAAWTDLVGLLVIVHGDGGDADAALRSSWLLDGVEAAAIDAWLALLGAFMCGQVEDATPSSVSTWLSRHRAYFGTSALSWLEARHSS